MVLDPVISLWYIEFMRYWIVRTAGLLAWGMWAIGSVCAGDGPSSPDFSQRTETYRIPFSKPVDYANLKSLHVRVSIDGGPAISMLVDTGSVGMVIGAADVPRIDPDAPQGSISYSSSGVELDGVWTPVTLSFPDSKDASGKVATAKVSVLAARERKVSGQGVNAAGTKPSKNPRVYMLGVGFGRGKDPHPERNPFINLNEMQIGTMNRGYLISPEGIMLGLTGKNTAKRGDAPFVYQKLEPRSLPADFAKIHPGLNDWQSPLGSFSVGSSKSSPARVLMDTGLTNMMLSDPAHLQTGDVPDDTPITVSLLNSKLNYTFKAGDSKNPTTPRKVTWTSPKAYATLNTGLRGFSKYNYLYDADGGYLGLQELNAEHP